MPPQRTPRETLSIFFFRDNFKMDLVRLDLPAFVRELRGRFADSGGPERLERARSPLDAPASAATSRGPSVFICHASEDKDKASQVNDALKRARLDPWLDQQALRGGDRWDDLIAATIEKVDYFVILEQ